jgi:hypothetical protein
VVFKPLNGTGIMRWVRDPSIALILFIAGRGFGGYVFYLSEMLRHLDPSAVIPDRVKTMLNTLAEGVLVLDKSERVVLRTTRSPRLSAAAPSSFKARAFPRFNGPIRSSDKPISDFPWTTALQKGATQTGIRLGLRDEADTPRTFRVNCTPILGGDGSTRGALTHVRRRHHHRREVRALRQMLEMLQQSRDEINRQNQELQAWRRPIR